MLFRDVLDGIFMEYDINITNKGEDILKTSANGERMINYNFY